MNSRPLSGYVYGKRLRVGFYGEVFRAHREDGREARILHIDPALASRPGFARALGQHALDLGEMPAHPHVVTTIAAARRSEDGVVAVITEPVAGAISLDALLAGSRRPEVPLEIAVAIARAVVAGLSHAHRLEVSHGAVHPRSVLIDIDGRVVLGDFAPARALAFLAADSTDDGALRAGLHGYLAPELVLGDGPGPAADVFAAGALAFDLAAGAPPPGDLPVPAALARAITHALHTDPRARYGEATAFESALAEAVVKDRIAQPSSRDIATFVTETQSASDSDLDADTADFVSSLGGGKPSQSGLRNLARIPAVPPRARRQSSLPLPPRPPSRPGDPLARTPTPLVIPRDGRESQPALDSMVDDVLASLESELPAAPRPPVQATEEPKIELKKRGLGKLVWAVITVAFLLAGGAGIYFATREQGGYEAEIRAAMQGVLDELAALSPSPGTLVIESEPPGAAVWLYLGDTPVRSFAVRAGAPHQLRIEKPGFAPVDVTVGKRHWKPAGDDLAAKIEATLKPATRPPASSPAPNPPPLSSAGHPGHGRMEVSSTPAGAAVWLYLGKTPDCRIAGIPAGRAYKVRVLKDGFAPGEAIVRDWPASSAAEPVTVTETISLTR